MSTLDRQYEVRTRLQAANDWLRYTRLGIVSPSEALASAVALLLVAREIERGEWL